MAEKPIDPQAEQRPRGPELTAVGIMFGFASIAITNRAMHRPMMFRPWMHLLLGAGGGFLGNKLAKVYDDTTDAYNRQYAGYAALPSWAYAQLSPEELSAELREQRLASLAQKFRELSTLEEKEYLEARAAGGMPVRDVTRLQ